MAPRQRTQAPPPEAGQDPAIAVAAGSEPERRRRTRVQTDFPKATLEDAGRIPKAIEEVNAGRPYPTTDVAIALTMSPGASSFRVLVAASSKYGLTTGGYSADRLEITPLGQRIAAPTSDEDRAAALFEAALIPATFAAIFDSFKGKKIPAATFLENTVVRDFAVPREHADAAVEIFTKNAQYVGLTRTTSNGQWLGTEPTGYVAPTPADETEANAAGISTSTLEESSTEVPRPREGDNPARSAPAPRGKGQAIFVGHGKNKKPLEQLEKILNEYGIPFKVAVDEPNKGRPISQKVAQIMEECGAAILIFTADEEFRSLDDSVVWRPSENVVYELGAAAVMYGQRIIIFKENGVTFPSNFRDIGYIDFDKDSLDAKGIDLFRELIAFKIIQVSVPS